MAFWSKERIEVEHARRALVAPYASRHIEQSAYALGVASEYAITSSDGGGAKRKAGEGEHITIPPGQFALFLTEETITVPAYSMAFISMKAKYKLRGLINVSGFHVDPGFSGRLKFAVYNAGSIAVDLVPGQRLFLIWYCDLDRPTEALYEGSHQSQDGITAEDVMSIRGMVVSPAGLSARVDDVEKALRSEMRRLENKVDTHQNWSRPLLTAVFVGIIIFLLNMFVKQWLEELVKSGGRASPSSQSAVQGPGGVTGPSERSNP
jgi:dCTP deaminase